MRAGRSSSLDPSWPGCNRHQSRAFEGRADAVSFPPSLRNASVNIQSLERRSAGDITATGGSHRRWHDLGNGRRDEIRLPQAVGIPASANLATASASPLGADRRT